MHIIEIIHLIINSDSYGNNYNTLTIEKMVLCYLPAHYTIFKLLLICADTAFGIAYLFHSITISVNFAYCKIHVTRTCMELGVATYLIKIKFTHAQRDYEHACSHFSSRTVATIWPCKFYHYLGLVN